MLPGSHTRGAVEMMLAYSTVDSLVRFVFLILPLAAVVVQIILREQ